MEISSILSSACSLYVKSGSADAAEETEELSDAEKLEKFKKEIWDEINSYPWDSVMNISIQITDAAFGRMMEDSDFKDEMLGVIYKEALAAHPPGHTTLVWIEESGYHGYAYLDDEAGEIAFAAHSSDKDSFFVQKGKNGESLNEIWFQAQQERKEQRERLDGEVKKSGVLKSASKHRADVAELYEEQTVVNA